MKQLSDRGNDPLARVEPVLLQVRGYFRNFDMERTDGKTSPVLSLLEGALAAVVEVREQLRQAKAVTDAARELKLDDLQTFHGMVIGEWGDDRDDRAISDSIAALRAALKADQGAGQESGVGIALDHNCVCRDRPGPWRGCRCGVYTDEHGDWCANENCRALLSERVPGYPTPHEESHDA